MSSLFPPVTSRSTISGGPASAQSSQLSSLTPVGAPQPVRRLTALPRVSVGNLAMVGPPAQTLSASRITQRTDATARLSGQVAQMTDTALQVADGVVSQPIAVADLALSMSYQGIQRGAEHAGRAGAESHQGPSTASDVGELVGIAFAGIDTALSIYSLKKTARARNDANGELVRYQAEATAFEEKLQARSRVDQALTTTRADLAQCQPVQTEYTDQVASWKQALTQLESEYRQIAPDRGDPLQRSRATLLMPGIKDRVIKLGQDIESLRTKLQDPERTFLQERRAQIAGQPGQDARIHQLDAFERRQVLADQINALTTDQQVLTDELRGIGASAQRHAIALQARAEARRDTAESAINVARAGTGLVRSALEGTQATISLAGGTSGSGLVAASHVAGTLAGGLAIVAGGAAIGIAAYRLNKASQRRDAIETALETARGQSNSEVINRAGRHAVERRSAQINTSKWNIVKGIFGIVGGSLAIAAITATGVGALALGIAALGIGIVSAATSIGTLVYGYRQGKRDVALRNEVGTEQARTAALEAYKTKARDAAVEAGEPIPTDEALEKLAHESLIESNPYYAIHVLAESLTRADTDPDRNAALEFLAASGLTESRLEQIRLLSTEHATEETRELLKKSIESHLLG
jgi:hypothetical protein